MCVMNIRWMIRRDLPALLDIEQDSFQFPWNERDFLRCHRCRNCIGMVVEQADCVVGFMIYELHSHGIHILNFAVDPAARNRGVGSAMLDKLTSKLGERRRRLTLAIRETNLPAQLFFSRHGFLATKVVKDAYDDTDEAAYFFEYDVTKQPSAVA